MGLNAKVREYSHQLNQQGLLRVRKLLEPDLIRFDSNDYLSLTRDERIIHAYQQGYLQYPTGSGASMLLSGYHPNHLAVERAFADLLQVDACILFSSGYAANLALCALLGAIQAPCFIDKKVHASIYDGLALSKVPYIRYRHNDIDDLSLKLDSQSADSVLITEGIFSMSGQIAPLARLSDLKGISLLVDEAHSFGVLGDSGKGAVACHGLTQNEVPLRIIPLGKSFAAQGALVAGQKEWIEALLQAGRSIIYSTALSPALSYGLLKTLEVVVAADDRRRKLVQLVQTFKEHIKASPLKWSSSETPIQQLHLGCPHLALHYAQELIKSGFSCSAIRPPTVSPQLTGLRIILNYSHEPESIHQLFGVLKTIYESTH